MQPHLYVALLTRNTHILELPRNLGINFWPLLKSLGGIISAEQGAAGHVMLASDASLSGVSGAYFSATTPGRHERARSSAASYDGDAAERLWRVSEQLTGATYAALGAK